MRISIAFVPWSAASSLYSPQQLNNQLNALQISNSFLLRSRSQRWVNIEKVETKKNRSSSQYHYKEKKFWMLTICIWLHWICHTMCCVCIFICLLYFSPRAAACARQSPVSPAVPECTGASQWPGFASESGSELLKCKIWLLPSQSLAPGYSLYVWLSTQLLIIMPSLSSLASLQLVQAFQAVNMPTMTRSTELNM